ncbi:MAG TPA: hypothetical protein VK644_15030 [Chitinophagaceae bacterium]|nr:hypothetical protein [Chitinophagaceae bacterium]
MKIRYNIPIEVNRDQYRQLMRDFKAIVAGRKEEGKFFIKVWDPRFLGEITKYFAR